MFSFGRSQPPARGSQPKPPVRQEPPSGSAQPVRLVYDENGKFVMDPAAVAALQKVKGPVGVVAVCGRARQGKSFILNQLLGRSSGFQVAPTVRPCTKGLWMWSEPIRRILPDGSEYHLVLLDSEGIDAYDQTGTYSTQIFSLAVLLSSMFVFNQMGGVDEAALDRLSLVTEMTKHIRVKASSTGGGVTSAAELSQFSPTFLWLLRDFYLDLSEDGRRITAKEYLESALMPTPGSNKAVAAKNQIRESIKALFPDRDCFTLVRPVHEEKQLQKLDTMPMEMLRPEFRQGLDELTRLIFARTRAKQMDGVSLTGPMLAALTQSFLTALNQGAVPTIATSWQSVAEGECRRASDSALEAYESTFDQTTPPEEAALLGAHTAALERALTLFQQEAVGSVAVRQPYEAKLKDTLAKKFQDHKKVVLLEAENRCREVLSSMTQRLMAAGRDPSATIDSLLKVLDNLVKEYERDAAGPAKWQRLVSFLHTSLTCGAIRELIQRASEKAAADVAGLQRQLAELKQRLADSEAQARRAGQEAADWHRKLDVEVTERKAAEARQATVLERATVDARQRETSMQEQHRMYIEGKEQRIKELQRQAEAGRTEAGDLSRRIRELEGKLSAAKRAAEEAGTEAERLRTEAARASSTAGSAEQERAEAERARVNAEAERQLAVQRADAAEGVRSEAEARAREAKADASRAEAQAAEAREALESLRQEVSKRVGRCEELEKDVKRLHEEVRMATEGKEGSGRVAAQLRDELREAQTQVAKLEAELRTGGEARSAADAELAHVRCQLAEKEAEKQRLLDEGRALQQHVGGVEKAKKDLEEEVAEMKAQAERAEKQHQEEMQQLGRHMEEARAAAQQFRKRACALVDEDMEGVEEDRGGAAAQGRRVLKRTRRNEDPEFEDAEPHFAGGVPSAADEENLDPPEPIKAEMGAGKATPVGGPHTKLTVPELKQALTSAGLAHEVLKLKKPTKKDLLVLYEKHLV